MGRSWRPRLSQLPGYTQQRPIERNILFRKEVYVIQKMLTTTRTSWITLPHFGSGFLTGVIRTPPITPKNFSRIVSHGLQPPDREESPRDIFQYFSGISGPKGPCERPLQGAGWLLSLVLDCRKKLGAQSYLLPRRCSVFCRSREGLVDMILLWFQGSGHIPQTCGLRHRFCSWAVVVDSFNLPEKSWVSAALFNNGREATPPFDQSWSLFYSSVMSPQIY